MTERMRITADGMTISRDKDGNVQWIQVEGVTLVRNQRAEKAEQTIKEISEVLNSETYPDEQTQRIIEIIESVS